MAKTFVWIIGSVLILAGIFASAIVFLTTPRWVAPKLSGAAAFRTISERSDSAWYEIELGKFSALPISVSAAYIPSRPYSFAIALETIDSASCRELATAKLGLQVKVLDSEGKVNQQFITSEWTALDSSAVSVFASVPRESCTLYSRPPKQVSLSKLSQYTVVVTEGSKIPALPDGARIILDGQG